MISLMMVQSFQCFQMCSRAVISRNSEPGAIVECFCALIVCVKLKLYFSNIDALCCSDSKFVLNLNSGIVGQDSVRAHSDFIVSSNYELV